MSKASDEEILAFSLATNAIVVILDADFQAILVGYESDLKSGSLVTVMAQKTKCHRLPVGGTG
jgi:predicted nuclease of predicted toxin-antitoxin system